MVEQRSVVPPRAFQGKQALIIDDDQAICTLVVRIFETLGCPCRAALTRAEGLALFRAEPDIEIVLLDHDMPDDLAELLDALRAQRPNTLFIGHSGANRREEFARLGVWRFLKKPWLINELLAVIEKDPTARRQPRC